MAKTNIAQFEQILNSLKQSLEKIDEQHHLLHHLVNGLLDHSGQAVHNLNISWLEIVNLVKNVDQLKLIYPSFEKS